MAIPRLHKEMSIFDPDSTIDAGIEDAGSKATNYLTTITGTSGISVHDAGDTSNYANISSSGMDVVQGGTSVASFGSTARIGVIEDGAYTKITASGLQLVNERVSSTSMCMEFCYGTTNKGIWTGSTASTETGPYASIGMARATTDVFAQYIGTSPRNGIGKYSVTFGGAGASGYSSMASGYSQSSGDYSTAIGFACFAYGHFSLALGAGTTKEENNYIRVSPLVAQGDYSVSIGRATIADGDNSTVIGKFNDTGNAAFTIGNGSGSDTGQRSDAFVVDWNGDTTAAGRFISTAMAGMIQMFGGSTAPTGWLLCNGAAVSRTDYAALFAVIGTTYGTGDGSTTFNLPNLQGRFPLGSSSSYALAATGGSADAIVPYHNHSMTSVLTSASVSIASTKAATGSSGISDIMRDTNGIGTLTSTDYAGTSGNLTGANMPPYVAVNYIICTGI